MYVCRPCSRLLTKAERVRLLPHGSLYDILLGIPRNLPVPLLCSQTPGRARTSSARWPPSNTPPFQNLFREVPCVSLRRPCRAANYLGITQLTPHELDWWDIQSTLCIPLSSPKPQSLHKKPKQWHHQYMIAVSPPTKMNDEEERSVLFRPRLCITKTSVPPGHICLPSLRNRSSTST
jgi:hypothetical protein